jgi:uncharacterized protein YjfI (DUF2170 family)
VHGSDLGGISNYFYFPLLLFDLVFQLLNLSCSLQVLQGHVIDITESEIKVQASLVVVIIIMRGYGHQMRLNHLAVTMKHLVVDNVLSRVCKSVTVRAAFTIRQSVCKRISCVSIGRLNPHPVCIQV